MAPNSLSSSEIGTLAKTHYAWLLPLFIGSGCAALMYEIIWFQSLQLIVGASALSLGVLLSTFMGGMCIGSLLLPLTVPRRWHPLRVYAGLELGIAIAALVLLDLLPTVEAFYVSEFHSGAANIWQANVISRAVIAGLCLLPPTILMGATLPAIARWFESNPQGVSQTGLFYTANIVGAVIGCLLAPFYLLRLFDMVTATYCAIAINVVVAGLGLAASYALPYQAHTTRPQGTNSRRSFQPVAYLAIGISGFAALGAEVIWTRELSLLLGATVYTFALILAVFLVALSLGSGVGSAWAKRLQRADLAFAFCQWTAALGVVWAAWITAQSLPYWPIDVSLTTNPWLTFQLDLVRVAWAVFPAAFSWGCSFPLALATAARGQDSGKMVGGIYAANTLGAIFGALGCSWLAIPQFGVQITHQIIIAALLLSAVLLMLATLFSRFRSVQKKGDSEINRLEASRATTSTQLAAAALLFVALTATAWAAFHLPAPPPGLAGYGRYLVTWLENEPEFLYSADGLSSSIAVSEFDDGQRNFHVSGKVVASSEAQDMRLQRMLGKAIAACASVSAGTPGLWLWWWQGLFLQTRFGDCCQHACRIAPVAGAPAIFGPIRREASY
ncbi:MAG: hypothetical protein NXI32_30490, partial [bacterium]|nr:hypothetical protein [bacterium]